MPKERNRKIYYISKNYNHPYAASSKAKIDVEEIIKKAGGRNLGLPWRRIENWWCGTTWTFFSNVLGTMRMGMGGLVFFQYPQHKLGWKFKIAKLKKNKTIVLIHDLNYIRYHRKKDLKYLYEADFLICHNKKMKEWLLERKIKEPDKIVCLEIFDYLSLEDKVQENLLPKYFSKNIRVAFAGNLTKSNFLNRISFEKITLKLFGIGGNDIKLGKGVSYAGCYPPEELHKHLDSHFGLIWDGDSDDKIDGILGEYLRYISPHKLSMYISCGLPVIVWEESAVADFVKENKIGISINSLKELESKLIALTEEEYLIMKNNLIPLREKVLNGYFLTKALDELSIKDSEKSQ